MTLSFIKAQALGNDFVLINCPPLTEDKIKHIADRRLGVGCDQVIFFQGSDSRIDVQFFNADGREAEACGNGSRALVVYLGRRAQQPMHLTLQTKTRILACEYNHSLATINMGKVEIQTAEAPILAKQLGVWGAVNMGNPHLIAIVEDLDAVDIEVVGKSLGNHPEFSSGVNVSVAQLVGDKIHLKTWERGAGYTGACGTAACAVAALAHDRGLIQGQTIVSQLGGDLVITSTDQGIFMLGSATLVFEGQFSFD